MAGMAKMHALRHVPISKIQWLSYVKCVPFAPCSLGGVEGVVAKEVLATGLDSHL